MTYVVQCKSITGHWRPIAFDSRHSNLELAIAKACSLDPDGFFSPDTRVVEGDGIDAKVVCTFKIWFEDYRTKEKKKEAAK